MNKKTLSERDICTKFITPALHRVGWDALAQIREKGTPTQDIWHYDEYIRFPQL